MKRPIDIRLLLQRRFANQHRTWLGEPQANDTWPLELRLGIPTQSQAMQQPDAVRAWASEWRSWSGPGELAWTERQWQALGTQRLPSSLLLTGPGDVAAWIGEQDRWQRAQQRSALLAQRWPALRPVLGKLFDVLADYPEEDYRRLVATVEWLQANPRSGLYLRQLPIAGLDSKWIEPRRWVVAELVAALCEPAAETSDFYAVCGLKKAPQQVRIRILDPVLRAHTGGLGDITAPVDELAQLGVKPAHVLVVENLQTGLALGELPGTIAVMGLGYGVQVLAALPWLLAARCLYWGDIDTHGLAILSKARASIAHVESLLMDEETLLRHRSLWSTEPVQHGASELAGLRPDEARLYVNLKNNFFGQSVRLEQERVDWGLAQSVISGLLGRSS